MTTRRIVRASVVAALYALFTLALAPLAFGPIQFRAANLLKPLVLFAPEYAVGIALGVFIGNIGSPFGALDFAIMPLVDLALGVAAWKLRRWPWLALGVQAVGVSIAVSLIPLGMGAGIPWTVTLPGLVVAQVVTAIGGYAIFKPYSKLLE